MREFQFESTYEDLEIGGKTFRIAFDDEAVKKYRDLIINYEAEAKRLQEETENTTVEEQNELHEKALALLGEVLDAVLGESSYDELYQASGQSSYNMQLLVEWLGVIIGERVKKMRSKNVSKYKK